MENIIKIAYTASISALVIVLIILLAQLGKLSKNTRAQFEALASIKEKTAAMNEKKEYISSVSNKIHLPAILLGLMFISDFRKNYRKDPSVKTALAKTVKKELPSQIKKIKI